MAEKRKDNKGRVLKENEAQRKDGSYQYRWRDRVGKRHYVYAKTLRFLYKGIIIKHNKTEPTYTKTSLFLCEKRRFFMGRTEKGGKVF